MHISGFVELTPRLDHEDLRDLAQAAYRASVRGPVALALNGVSQASIGQHLDSLVREGLKAVEGVWFVPVEEIGDELVDLAASAQFVVVDSPELSEALVARGVSHRLGAEGIQYLTASGSNEAEMRGPAATVRCAPATPKPSLAGV